MFETELIWAAGAVLLLFYFLYREARIAKLKETISSLKKLNIIYLKNAQEYEKKAEENKEMLSNKEEELKKEVENLKSSIESLTNRFITMQNTCLESTSCPSKAKKKSPKL